MKYEAEFLRYFSKVRLFSFKDARRFLKRLGASDSYVKLFIHLQARRHGLLKIGKGYYTFVKNDASAGFAFSPFYYGLEHALTIHKLWTQMTNPVIITASKAIPGARTSMGYEVTVRRISEKMFFGIEYVRYGGVFVPVSDVEKTLIDFLYFRIGISEDDMESLLGASDKGKLARYSRRCNRRIGAAVKKLLA